MKHIIFVIAFAAVSLCYSCKNNDTPLACADLAAATLEFQGQDLETVQEAIQGVWHLDQIDGGLRPSITGPDLHRTKLALTKTTLLWTRSDTIIHQGNIVWKLDAADHTWKMDNFGLTPYDIFHGRLRFNWRDIEFDGVAYTFARECKDAD